VNILDLLTRGDAASRAVSMLLLAMSVASWVVIAWKGWLLRRAGSDVTRGIAAFWQAATLAEGRQRLAALDHQALVLPLLEVVLPGAGASLSGSVGTTQRLTRLLRDALFGVLARLRQGQVLLATIGSTAPFVGLLGTVWGIHHALLAIASAGQITIERVAAPVGEALVMTAAGLAVAIPSVLAYNWFGRLIHDIELRLEGFAHDLCGLAAEAPAGAPALDGAAGSR
jgi:biopolymer transport protein ExbB